MTAVIIRNRILKLLMLAALLLAVPFFAYAAEEAQKVRIDTTYAGTAVVTFEPMEGAAGYFLTATETTGRKESVTTWARRKSGQQNAPYRTILQGLVPEREYSLEITAHFADGTNTVYEDGIIFRACPLPEARPRTKPAAWLSEVTDKKDGTFTAVIETARTPGLIYEASVVMAPDDLRSSTFPVMVPLHDVTRIHGLTTESVITVRHGKPTEKGILWSGLTTEITFPRDIDLYREGFILSVEGGTFSWKGADLDGCVALYRHTAEGGSVKVAESAASESGTFSYEEERGLESALYYASTGDAVSTPVFWTSGPAVSVSSTQREIVLTWKEPAGSSISYSGIMTPAKDRFGNVTLRIANLRSNTPYDFSIKAIFGDGRKAETVLTAKTESYAGVYEWHDKHGSSKSVPSFRVTVKEAPAASDFGYYIYTNPGDPKCIDDGAFSEERLMPLYDESLGDVPPTDFISFHGGDKQSSSYRWNEGKWNKGSLHPNSWMPVSMDISQDRYESVVKSKAAFGVKVDTRTVFEFFIASDGTPMLRFTNKAEGSNAGLANGALYRNVNPDTTLGEDEYTYALQKVR